MRTLARSTPLRVVLDAIAQQNALLAEINARLGRLEQARVPRDASDRQLLSAIAESALGTRFTPGEVFRHSRHAPALTEALRAADIDNSIQLGLLLRRVSSCAVNGWRLERVDEIDRDGGRAWHFEREVQR